MADIQVFDLPDLQEWLNSYLLNPCYTLQARLAFFISFFLLQTKIIDFFPSKIIESV